MRVSATTAARPAVPALAWLRARVHIAWLQLAMLASVLAALPFVTKVDPDYWWHWRTGELIVRDGFPAADPFSFTAAGKTWLTHEWLSEAVIYLVVQGAGYAAAALLFGGVTLAALALMYILGRDEGAGTKTLVGLALVSAVVFASFVTVRPQAFTWLLFAAFVFVLDRHDRGERAPLWALPPLMALWANLHLGFVYGVGVVGLWFLARAFARWRGEPVDVRTPALLVAACVAAATLNPDGPALLAYPVRYYFEGQVDRSLVDEWQRPDPLSPYHWPILAIPVLMALALASRTRPRPFLWYLGAVTAVLSLLAVRNAPFAALMLLPVVGGVAGRRWNWLSRQADSRTTVPVSWLPIAALSTALFVVVLNVSAGKSVSFLEPSERGYPEAGVAYLRKVLPGARVFNEYSWGGYLDAKLYPDGRVFVDGRADFFGATILREYMTVMRADAGWEDILDRYGVDAVLLPKEAHLARALREHPGWREAFTGPVESVFLRREGAGSPQNP
ncbi:MAG TPA: hypothetical protein VNM43_02840 [Dehalococcoidia bacterium]|nr:hypothetical protein [Dehalococcoidia bacterium]